MFELIRYILQKPIEIGKFFISFLNFEMNGFKWQNNFKYYIVKMEIIDRNNTKM